jgi:hypothetical protein
MNRAPPVWWLRRTCQRDNGPFKDLFGQAAGMRRKSLLTIPTWLICL